MTIDYAPGYKSRRKNLSKDVDTQDIYQYGAQRRTQPRASRTRLWAWLIGVGISAGIMAGTAIYVTHKLAHVVSTQTEHHQSQPKRIAKIRTGERNRTHAGLPPKVKSKFSFYTMLPKYRAVATHLKPYQPPVKPNNGEGPTQKFFVQVAAFKKRAPAKKLMQQLDKSGLNATLRYSSEQHWYKVRIGPENETKVDHTLARISTMQLNGLVIPAKG